MAKNELTVASENKEATLFVSDEMFEGANGLENVSSSDILLSRLAIVQKTSPQLDKSEPSYIPGCEYGDIIDTATGEVFKEIQVIACAYSMQYLEWAPRNTGGGLIHNYGVDASIMHQTRLDENKRNVLPNGNYIAETATWHVLNLTAGGRRSFIPLVSTGLKRSRLWLTKITTEKLPRKDGTIFKAPLYYRSWVINTVDDKNAKGGWKAFNFTAGEPILAIDPSKNLLREAKEFCEEAKKGLVKVDLSNENESVHSASEIPF